MTDSWTFTWVAGPDAGGTSVVGIGAHIVGRAAGLAVRCDDPAVEQHHLLVEVAAEGATVRRLSGRTPVWLDGEPLVAAVTITVPARLEIGHSILTVIPGDLTAPGHAAQAANITITARGSVVVRSPRAAPTWDPQPLTRPSDAPAGGDASGGLLPAVLALGGAGLLAVLLHQPMFFLFGAIGAVAAFGTWGGQRIGMSRRRRREVKQHAAEVARFERSLVAQRGGFVAHRLAHDSTVTTARQAIELRTADLWARRGEHADGFVVSVGLGAHTWAPVVADIGRSDPRGEHLSDITVLADLPVLVDVGAGCRVAVRGKLDRATAIVRAILLQLAANCGPGDVRFVVVTHEASHWRWLRQLPHATSASGAEAIVSEDELCETVAELDAAPNLHVVVITDSPQLLAARTSALRRVMSSARSTALIVVAEETDGIPHVCASLLDVSGPTHAGWHADVAGGSLPVQTRWCGIGERSATALACSLGTLVDPEDPLSGAGAVPREVTLLSLLPSHDAEAIAASWVAAGVDPPPRTAIGVAADGVVDIDLVRDGPHALLAGTTGAGKSELLRSLVAGLAAASSPDHLTFVLIDYKGGATFDACAELPHVVGVVTDLDDHLAARALRSLHAELRHREQLLRRAGAADLSAFRHLCPHEILPRLVVIIDEFASLVSEQPDFLHALVGIAQRGRSLGVHLILATQRPNGVISDDIRANTNLRIALRLHDAADALDVVGDRAPAAIPRGLAGRAVMRFGPDEVLTFQTARCTASPGDGDTELGVLVHAVRSAASLVGVRHPQSPWLAPLPTTLPGEPDDVRRGVVGIIDDPDQQRMVPLRWQRSEGHLLLIGAAGSGVTSALGLVAGAAVAGDSSCHLYVIDGHGDEALQALQRSQQCGGVVRLHERERLIRLLNRLERELADRVADPRTERPPIVLLVDGLDSVRNALDDLGTSRALEILDRIVAIGPAHDIVLVCSFDRVAGVPAAVLARCAERWIFHLADPLDAAGLGIAAAAVPGPVPGRIVVASTGLEAQLMTTVWPRAAEQVSAGERPTQVECLPDAIDASTLPVGCARGDDSVLPIGLRFDDGAVAAIEVPDGEHVLIVGPARSGRSTALQQILRAWRELHPDCWWRVVAPRRSVFDGEHRCRTLAEVIDDIPPVGRVLVAVDDAELVDDVGGALAALAASARPGLLIVATGKPDSLRHSYGHWTGAVRRSRLGIVTTAANDLDGDLLGAQLPRHLPIPPRPGLAWLVADGGITLAQLASGPAAPDRLAVFTRST